MNEEGAQKNREKKSLKQMTVNEANVAFKLFSEIFLPSLNIFFLTGPFYAHFLFQ
jgi:hypothetical protein